MNVIRPERLIVVRPASMEDVAEEEEAEYYNPEEKRIVSCDPGEAPTLAKQAWDDGFQPLLVYRYPGESQFWRDDFGLADHQLDSLETSIEPERFSWLLRHPSLELLRAHALRDWPRYPTDEYDDQLDDWLKKDSQAYAVYEQLATGTVTSDALVPFEPDEEDDDEDYVLSAYWEYDPRVILRFLALDNGRGEVVVSTGDSPEVRWLELVDRRYPVEGGRVRLESQDWVDVRLEMGLPLSIADRDSVYPRLESVLQTDSPVSKRDLRLLAQLNAANEVFFDMPKMVGLRSGKGKSQRPLLIPLDIGKGTNQLRYQVKWPVCLAKEPSLEVRHDDGVVKGCQAEWNTTSGTTWELQITGVVDSLESAKGLKVEWDKDQGILLLNFMSRMDSADEGACPTAAELARELADLIDGLALGLDCKVKKRSAHFRISSWLLTPIEFSREKRIAVEIDTFLPALPSMPTQILFLYEQESGELFSTARLSVPGTTELTIGDGIFTARSQVEELDTVPEGNGLSPQNSERADFSVADFLSDMVSRRSARVDRNILGRLFDVFIPAPHGVAYARGIGQEETIREEILDQARDLGRDWIPVRIADHAEHGLKIQFAKVGEADTVPSVRLLVDGVSARMVSSKRLDNLYSAVFDKKADMDGEIHLSLDEEGWVVEMHEPSRPTSDKDA